ncbi:hypothetical protein TMatcc_001652 [Talaromyces marneffei ATCC 18224]
MLCICPWKNFLQKVILLNHLDCDSRPFIEIFFWQAQISIVITRVLTCFIWVERSRIQQHAKASRITSLKHRLAHCITLFDRFRGDLPIITTCSDKIIPELRQSRALVILILR